MAIPTNYPAGYSILPPGHSYVASRKLINDAMTAIYALITNPTMPQVKIGGDSWEVEKKPLLKMIEACATDLVAGTAGEIATSMEKLERNSTYNALRWDFDGYLAYLVTLDAVVIT